MTAQQKSEAGAPSYPPTQFDVFQMAKDLGMCVRDLCKKLSIPHQSVMVDPVSAQKFLRTVPIEQDQATRAELETYRTHQILVCERYLERNDLALLGILEQFSAFPEALKARAYEKLHSFVVDERERFATMSQQEREQAIVFTWKPVIASGTLSDAALANLLNGLKLHYKLPDVSGAATDSEADGNSQKASA